MCAVREVREVCEEYSRRRGRRGNGEIVEVREQLGATRRATK